MTTVKLPPTVKYTLGRVGLFVVVFGALLLVPGIDLFLKLMVAILASFGLQFVLLRRWRQEMIDYIDGSMARSRAEKAKLRAALAGDDDADTSAEDRADDEPAVGERPGRG